MSERQGRDRDVELGEQRLEDAPTAAFPQPGKRTLTSRLANDRSVARARETVQRQPAETEPAHENDSAELREAEAWLEDVRMAFQEPISADVHVCYAGCVHGQFEQMMAHTSTGSGGDVDDGALEAAYKKWTAEQALNTAPDPHSAPEPSHEPAPAPAMEPIGEGDSSVAFSGAVSSSKPGGFPNPMGQAKWDYAGFTYPDLKLKTEKILDHGDGDPSKPGVAAWNTEVQPTTSADAATSAVATPAGVYAWPAAGTHTLRDEKNRKVVLKKQIDVSAAAAAQIKDAEQEHLDDVTQAYTITLKSAETAVNAVATTFFTDQDKAKSIKMAKDAVKDALDPKLGSDPKQWRAMLRTCAELTKSGRDASKWHSFDLFADVNAGAADFTKKLLTYKVLPNSNVGSTSSATLIKL